MSFNALFALCVDVVFVVIAFEGSNALPPFFGGRIKHVIAIMFENRSFDHMLGYLRGTRTDIDGCLPSMGKQCANPLNPHVRDSPLVYIDNEAVYVQPGDPDHCVSGTSLQLFGVYGNNQNTSFPPPMDGFVSSYSTHEKSYMNDSGAFIMQSFNQTTLPILNTLANEFAVIDQWFSDVPGPTEPNRIFAFMGTSKGMGTDNVPRLVEGFDGPNVFSMIDEYGPDNMPNTPPQKWRSYFQDAPTSGFLNYVRLRAEHGRPMTSLFEDIENGELPLYSWLDPQYSDNAIEGATDQHPDHDVTLGEKLLKKIYESLRASSLWNDTLLLVYYDEHGGFFDHVPPPSAPNPDGLNSFDVHPPFDFGRLGVRIPVVLVSPWIKKGTVATRPVIPDEPQYCHSSLIKTLREQFAPDSPSFTSRDAWALTFEQMINLREMRTDCPMVLPAVPVPPTLNDANYVHRDWIPGQQPLHDSQKALIQSAAKMCHRENEVYMYMNKQEDMNRFLKSCMKTWMKNGY